MIIGIAGPTASGKTTIAKILEKERSAIRIRFSSILSEMARARGLNAEDKAVLQQLFVEERELRGESFLTEELISRVSLLKPEILVIEDIRRLGDVHGLKKLASSRHEALKLIFIDAPRDVRFSRYNKDPISHGYQKVTRKEFEVIEKNPAEDEVSQVCEIFKSEGLYIDTSSVTIDETMKKIYDYMSTP